MNKVVRLFLIFSLLIPLGGCGASPWGVVGVGAGVAWNLYVTWKNGEATKYYKYDTVVVHRALCMSLKDLDQTVISDSSDQNAGKSRSGMFSRRRASPAASKNFHMVAGNNNRFKIKIEHVDKDICRLKVRIDFWGDKPYVEMMYQKVDEYLNVVTYGPDGKPRLNNQRPH